MEDVKGRCEMCTMPDKTEVFVFDGKEMVAFYPVELKQRKITKISATQRYRVLYYEQNAEDR